MDQEILDADFHGQVNTRRRNLLPWWIKTFIWIFLLFSVMVPVSIILGLLGTDFDLSLYGLATNKPFSWVGLSIIGLFALKGITAYALWTEKDWAIDVGLTDAIIGIVTCAFVMFVYPSLTEYADSKLNWRLEIILLIPYLLKLNKIKPLWCKNKAATK
jgi:hypothetical protein